MLSDNRMSRLAPLLVAVLVASCQRSLAPGREPPAQVGDPYLADPSGFALIFDGESTAGWKRHDGVPPSDVGGKWLVEEGVLVGMQDPPGRGGFLCHEGDYQDFVLSLEAQLDWTFDSGLFLRVGPDGKSHQVTLDHRRGGEIGGIYLPWTQGFVHHCPHGAAYFKRDGWNRVTVQIEGEPARIQVWVNGQRITDFQHTARSTAGVPGSGAICLQVHPGGWFRSNGGRARFRNLMIKRLEGGAARSAGGSADEHDSGDVD